MAELLPLSRSGLVAATVAVLVYAPMALGVTRTVTVAVDPALIAPRMQIIGALPAHVPWVGVAETSVSPPAKVSVSVVAVAVDGPLLVTLRVNVRFCGKKAEEPATLTVTSAWKGLTATATRDQLEVPLKVSDSGTLGAPARVLPVPRTSVVALLLVEFKFHRDVCVGPKALIV